MIKRGRFLRYAWAGETIWSRLDTDPEHVMTVAILISEGNHGPQ